MEQVCDANTCTSPFLIGTYCVADDWQPCARLGAALLFHLYGIPGVTRITSTEQLAAR